MINLLMKHFRGKEDEIQQFGCVVGRKTSGFALAFFAGVLNAVEQVARLVCVRRVRGMTGADATEIVHILAQYGAATDALSRAEHGYLSTAYPDGGQSDANDGFHPTPRRTAQRGSPYSVEASFHMPFGSDDFV